MKATAIAPTNIAFIKYWGKKDNSLRLPLNSNISVNLSGLSTTTSVEFSSFFSRDDVLSDRQKDDQSIRRIIKHLDLIRKVANKNFFAKVRSVNSFPTASGLASSASGFAALTVASCRALNLDLSAKELTIIARQGSGSACRSIPDGWVEWLKGSTNNNSYAYTIFPSNYWDINIVTVIVNNIKKDILSTKGMDLVLSNPFLKTRLRKINKKIELIKQYIYSKKFTEFGELVEKEALELHAMTLTSEPPIIYWEPATIELIKLVWRLRKEGLESYFTIDAGPHLKIICQNKDLDKLIIKLRLVEGVKKIISNKISSGTKLIDSHLF